ncbi:MAG: hypothetical protein RIR70_1311 [Pseudomonadota bacterium]|jgi:general secretion pathway protein D
MNRQTLRKGFAAVLLGLCLAGPAVAAPANDEASLNFVNADIESVIRAMGPLTGKTFLIDPKVQGTLTVISGGPVDKRLIYPILLSALRSQGFAAIESGGVVRIAPEGEAKHNFSPRFDAGSMSGDRIATAVFKLKNQSANQVLQTIRPMVGPNQAVSAFAGTNSIVITDTAENLKRIQGLIETLDMAGRAETTVVAMRFGSASDVAAMAQRLLAAEAKPDTPAATVVIAEPRNNTILVRSESQAAQERAVALVRQLDESLNTESHIQVVKLRNADATKLAQTLRSVLTGVPAPAASSAAPTSITTAGQAGLGGATSAVPGAAEMSAARGGDSGGPAGSTSIQADVATNSLIITAPPPVFRTLREVIEKLDTRRPQVFIEVLITEVSNERLKEMGVQWQSILGLKDNPNALASIALGRNAIVGTASDLNLGFVARALETEADANILSSPNLLTLDNEEARIVIGKNVPITTGKFTLAGDGGGGNPFQTIERRDVGIKLKVRPQVSDSGSIRLFLSQEVSSVAPSAAGNSEQVFNVRSIDSNVLVDDGKIAVLGGLLDDDASRSVDKVPALGDAPLVGGLFRNTNKKRNKTNLMVFLRPQVLRDVDASAALTKEKIDLIRDAQKNSAAKPGPEWTVNAP